MDVKKAIGARIRELRHSEKYTQEEFAEIINVAPRHISRIENGVNMPSIETLEKIANVFNLELRDLCNFQHLYDETYLKNSVLEIVNDLNSKDLSLAYKVLSAIFK